MCGLYSNNRRDLTTPASVDDVSKVLAKVLASGQLNRIPRHPDHRDVVLALLCLHLRRRYPYPEPELNELLIGELARLRARVDHVTARRYMVDCGFLKRDRAGQRYFLNYPKLEGALASDVAASAPRLIDQALQPRRSLRDDRRQA